MEIAKPVVLKKQFLGVYDNSKDAILKLDFSFLNLKFYKLDSKKCRAICKSNANSAGLDPYSSFFDRILNNSSGYHPYLYALLPIDFNKPIPEEYFHYIEKYLLIIFPSDFYLKSVVTLYYPQEENTKLEISHMVSYDYHSHWYLNPKAHHEALLLKNEIGTSKSINNFIKRNWEAISESTYLDIAISSYANGFKVEPTMGYISYCIALESLIDGTTEVTDKISRSCAVINSKTKEEGLTIFRNAKKIYALRSQIVHGEKYNYEYLYDIFFSLQALVSRTLIELLNFQLKNRKELADIVNQNGFGDRKKFIKNYKSEVFNPSMCSLLLKELPNSPKPK